MHQVQRLSGNGGIQSSQNQFLGGVRAGSDGLATHERSRIDGQTGFTRRCKERFITVWVAARGTCRLLVLMGMGQVFRCRGDSGLQIMLFQSLTAPAARKHQAGCQQQR